MTTLYDQHGREFRLGAVIGRGGEGGVHSIHDDPKAVAKVLVSHRRTRHKHRKLRAMVARPPRGAYDRAHGFPVLTWPKAVLYTDAERCDDATFVGYTMARIEDRDFVPVFRVTSASRRVALGGAPFTWDRLVRFAVRLCHVVRTLHRFGYAVGDLNDRNVLVSRSFTPLLMDTDSFQVPKVFGHHPSTVGDQLYWAPELLDVDLNHHRSGRMHGDRFALATLLFQLFMNGMRPYQARGSKVDGLDTLAAKTRAGHFPWSDPRPGVLEPPVGAPDFRTLPNPIRRAFERCFIDGHTRPRRRPSAHQWVRILHRAVKRGFATCDQQATHVYAAGESDCPWCQDANNPYGAPAGPPTPTRPSKRERSRRRRPTTTGVAGKEDGGTRLAFGDRVSVRIAWQVLLLAALAAPFLVLRSVPPSTTRELTTAGIPLIVVAALGAAMTMGAAHSQKNRWRIGGAWAVAAGIGMVALLWTGPHPWLQVATTVACLTLGLFVLQRVDPRGPLGWRPDVRGAIAALLAVAAAFAPIMVLLIAAAGAG